MAAAGDTCISVLTPQGRGAIAVIAVTGPHAETAVDRWFRPVNGQSLSKQLIKRILFGHWGAEHGEEVVVCRREIGNVEIHCHGGIAAARAIVGSLVAAGAREINWQATLAAADADPIAAAAHDALADAKTERTSAVLLDQFRGALGREITTIEQLAATTEATNHHEAMHRLQQLLARAPFGLHLTEPWRVVIGGEPNVGKSSLINALVGYQRALVFETPGTTRDVVTALTAFDGWPVQLTDTAGLRSTQDAIEAEGVARAMEQIHAADLLLLVFDLARPWTSSDDALCKQYPQAIVVHNKCDLAKPQDDRPPGIRVSARSGEGLERLQQAIAVKLVPAAPEPGQPVPFTRAQIQELQAMQASLSRRLKEVV